MERSERAERGDQAASPLEGGSGHSRDGGRIGGQQIGETAMLTDRKFRPDIEGLRAIAVILVLLYHAQIDMFRGGFIGVDVFLVLSGYLITRSLLEEAEREGRIRVMQFYARRVRRLLPASVLVLLATGAGVVALLPVTMWRAFGGDIAAAGAYFINWRLAVRSVDYLAEDVLASPVQHFWTLAVEEQFYLVWPLLLVVGLAIALRWGWRLRTVTGVVLLATVGIPSLVWSIALTSFDPPRAFFVTTTRMWELAMGALAAVIAPQVIVASRRLAVSLKVAALSSIVGMAVMLDGATSWPGAMALVPTIATATLVLVGRHDHGDRVERMFAIAPMQSVGAWSYSLYLWHWPPLAIFAARWGGLTTSQAVLIVVLAAIPAWLSYRFVENPIRHSQVLQRSPRFTLSVGANLSLAGVMGGLALILLTPLGPSLPAEGGGAEATESHGAGALTPGLADSELLATLETVDWFVPGPAFAVNDVPEMSEECQAPRAASVPVVCEYGDRAARRHVALVGDSKILQWAPAFVRLAEENGWRVTSITKSACALTTSVPIAGDDPYPECQEWSGQVIDLLRSDPPDIMFTSQAGSRAVAGDVEQERLAMIDGMLRAYEMISDAGVEVVLLLDNPHPGFTVYECVAENPEDLGTCTFSRDRAMTSGGRSVQLEVAEAGPFRTVDLLHKICPTETCLPVIGNVLVYRQGSHLTASYVETLVSPLAVELEPYLSLVADGS